ncbi:MAG: LPS-assembly protein LptD, partial [Rickettsiales bacterium]|nr:LPS-assembly protein LptD [Rickettsiales bacterium]
MRTRVVWTILTIFVSNFCSYPSYAVPAIKKQKNTAPALLKAKTVEGNRIRNEIVAIGDVEISKGTSVLYADKIIYDQNNKELNVIGEFRADDFEVGNLYGKDAFVKDDLSQGEFFNTKIVFNDGSYLKSSKIKKESIVKTKLQTPIYSICPDPLIVEDNKTAGDKTSFVSIKS